MKDLLRMRGSAVVRAHLRSVIGILLFIAVAGLVPLAYASPTDSIVLPGLYDLADGDEIVVLLADTVALHLPAVTLGFVRDVMAFVVRLAVADPVPRIGLAFHLRSPPSV